MNLSGVLNVLLQFMYICFVLAIFVAAAWFYREGKHPVEHWATEPEMITTEVGFEERIRPEVMRFCCKVFSFAGVGLLALGIIIF